jgi:hypothetical protein
MNKQLIYSILQYKHSPVLGEAINVGVLFYFPDEEKKIHLHITDASRIKPIYKDFDPNYFKALLKIIDTNIDRYSGDLLAENLLNNSLKDFINSYLLKEDDTVLQFTELFTALNVFSSVEKAIEEYTRLLLPLSLKKETEIIKYNETFIIRKFKTKLLSYHEDLIERVQKDYKVEVDELSFKFDIAWQNGSLNLVHPLSFDLQDIQAIQRKTAEYCSYLSWLNKYTKENNCRIDLLLARPQESKLQNSYNKSIKLLEAIDSNKMIVDFEEIDDYTDNAARYLLSIQ